MLLSKRESSCAKMQIFFAKNRKYLQNIKLDTRKQVFTAINGILIVKLERILPLKMQKLQPKMFILTAVHVIALENSPSINFLQKFFFC